MVKQPKKKNISPYLADVRPSKNSFRSETKISDKKRSGKEDKLFRPNIKNFFPKNRFWRLGILIVFILIAGIVLLSGLLWSRSGGALYNLRPLAFDDYSQVKQEEGGGFTLDQLFGVLRTMPMILSSVKNLNEASLEIAILVAEVKSRGLNWLFEDGQSLLHSLKNIEEKLIYLESGISGFYQQLVDWGGLNQESADLFSFLKQLETNRIFLSGLIDFLSEENQFLIFLENGSEIRPAGGFIGSYAEIKIKAGQIEEIEVYDILMPDNLWNSRVVPPQPLQLVTQSWEARDANWFFDFPTSAKKTIGFIESSPFYADKGIQFSGAIGINHRVIADILKITGPVELVSYDLKLDENNFLFEIQKEVSTDAFKRGSERKQILKELASPLIKAVKSLNYEKQTELLSLLTNRVEEKDLRIYFKDSRLQGFLAKLNVDGSVYALPGDFSGDYLAVVNANIASGKSDIFIKQRIVLESQLLHNGSLKNHLQIIRSHLGDREKESYYQAINRNFIRILTPPSVQLISVVGASKQVVKPLIDYARAGYQTDSEIEALEKGEESGKQVLGYWFNIAAGETGKLEISYERPSVLTKNTFQFVYEKQSGVDSELEYRLEAPAGYIFVESGKREFVYQTENAPARLIINLTLEKN